MFGRVKEQPSPQSQVGGVGAISRPVGEGGGERGGGPREGLILLIFTLLTLAASGYVIATNEHDALHDPTQKAARGEVKGLSELSLLREENLRKALAKVADGKHPLINSIRVSAERVDFTVLDSDGYRKLVHIDPAFKVTEDDFGVGEDTSVRASQIDAAAPERIVRALGERTRLGEEAIDYVTTSFSGSPPYTWYASLDEGPARVRQWIAAPDGSDIRKPGDPSEEQRRAEAKRQRDYARQQREYARQQRQYMRRSACLQKAHTPQALQRCIRKFST